MKRLFFWMTMGLAASVSAQNAMDEMIAAERSFAAHSVTYGTRAAFLKFLDTTAVMFNNAKPINGHQSWYRRPKAGFVLNWWPTYAEVANSNDWGWTAGPWTFRASSLDSVSATGYFFTVWAKKTDGWKVVLDVGTESGPITFDTSVRRWGNMLRTGGYANQLTDEEDSFHLLYAKDSIKAYDESAELFTLFAREGRALSDGLKTWKTVPTAPGSLRFERKGVGISRTGDLAYTFGSVELNGRKETYLRIWRHDFLGWLMVLEMLRL